MTERGQKIRDAFRAKYGVDHPSQLPWVKEKIKEKRSNGAYCGMVEKMQKTKLEKYGDSNFGNVKKGSATKLEKYGDANFNNREKMLATNVAKYGMRVSPNTLASTIRRVTNNEIGFSSSGFKKFLDENHVTNASQLPTVKAKKIKKQMDAVYIEMVGGARLNNVATPLFSREEYVGTEYDRMYKFKCNTCGEEFEDNLYSGNIPRCLTCRPFNTNTSAAETELAEFVKSLGSHEIKMNDRVELGGLELDLFVPEKSIAIELDGIFWHTELGGNKPKSYHLQKTVECAKKGIRLLHIFDQEWEDKKPLVKSMIAAQFGTSQKMYARKLRVVEIDDARKRAFLVENHIQGNDRSKIRLALVDDSEKIYSLMTFCKSRYNKSCEYELSRYCNLIGHQVVGGAGKLFSAFIKSCNPSSVISYCDKRLFSGAVYESIGMIKQEDTAPSYYYTLHGRIVGNRIAFQKHKLKDLLSKFDPTLSEWENMKMNGFDRVWDCGNLKYIWTKPTERTYL